MVGRLSADKLSALKRAFIEKAMSPGQAAQAVGVAEATAKRYSTFGEMKLSAAWRAGAELGSVGEARWEETKVGQQNDTIVPNAMSGPQLAWNLPLHRGK